MVIGPVDVSKALPVQPPRRVMIKVRVKAQQGNATAPANAKAAAVPE
jgi:hypothetical protein